MATLTIITSGVEWSLARARDFGCEYISPMQADNLAAHLVNVFNSRTGLTWDTQTSTVSGPTDWDENDLFTLHDIREDCADGVFSDFMDSVCESIS